MKRGNLLGQRHHLRRVQAAFRSHPVEQRGLVEPLHLDDPVDRRARTTQCQPTGGGPHDWDDARVQAGGSPAVDTQFRVAEAPAQVGRREVQIVVFDRPFQLEGPRSRQEHDRGMRLDALNGPRPVRRWVRQQSDDFCLAVYLAHGRRLLPAYLATAMPLESPDFSANSLDSGGEPSRYAREIRCELFPIASVKLC
jgi:hypothetical protein